MKSKKNNQTCIKAMLCILLLTVWSKGTAQEQMSELKDTPNFRSFQTTISQYSLPSFDSEYLELIQGVQYAFPVNQYLGKHIDLIPALSENIGQAVSRSYHSISELLHITNSLAGARAGGFGPPVSGSWTGLTLKNEYDIGLFFKQEGVRLEHPDEWNKLPFAFRKGILDFLIYIDRAKTTIDQYNRPIAEYLGIGEGPYIDGIREKLMKPWASPELNSWESIQVIGLADQKKLAYASRLASEKLSWFLRQTCSSIPSDFKSCTITTSMGECLINGIGNDTIEGNRFCVIESGGDDVYLGNIASSRSLSQPIGIHIDLSGDDKYLCEGSNLVTAVLGIAILLDLEGNDYYLTRKPGLSFSVFGCSILCDYSGNDVYVSLGACAQASAFVGTSIFLDTAGDDKYTGQSYSQGFGGTLGIGLFYDHLGDDDYNILNIGGRSCSANFVLGAAKGRWAEATDGQSLAGGIGIFIDHSGTDEYAAGSFAQGASYYFGLGLFADCDGNDDYSAISHSQGYAAHYSMAVFSEWAGNDIYNKKTDKSKITQIIGGGRDYSAGLFLDYKGDDVYYFGNRSAGIGDLNGIGLLADHSGNDRYLWSNNEMNTGFSSMGRTYDEESGVGLSVKIIPKGDSGVGIFLDSNGDGLSGH